MIESFDDRLLFNVTESGVEIRGTFIGVTPFRTPLIQAIASGSTRSVPTSVEGRILTIADDLGISFLSDAASDKVFWIDVALEYPKWRPNQASDAKSLFSGIFQMKGKKLPLPLTVSLAELLQEVEFAHMNISFVAHGKTIAAIAIAFPLHEPDSQAIEKRKT